MGQIVDKYKPEVLVIENEENSALFYTGTPRQYHQQLRAGCEVAHSKGTKCTNGGLVSELVVLLVTDNMVQKGQISMANEFLQVSLGEKLKSQFGLVNADAGKLLALPKVAEMVSKGKLLMNGYKADGADYINFHWYVADAQSLATSVKYLEQASGLPAVTNEVGQQNSTDPVWVTTVMQKIVDLKLPVAVWFSVDTPGFGQAKSLIDSDGKLRSNGEAFGEFVRHL